MTPNVWGFSSHQQPILQLAKHQIEDLQVSSVLTLTTWSLRHIPQGLSRSLSPISDANHRSRASHTSDQPAKIRGSHNPLLSFNNLPEQLTELRKALYLHLPVSYKGYYKGYR